jgi:phosphohistidine phosphatase
MKTLLVLRHGKAERDHVDGDHARELTERGKNDSATMGAYIAEHAGVPDAILTSDAARALQTAEIVAANSEYSGELTVVPQIYDASLTTLLALARSILDEIDLAVVVGHNPGFEEMAAALAGIDEDDVLLPTAGMALLEFDIQTWDHARKGVGRWMGIITPKGLREADAEQAPSNEE